MIDEQHYYKLIISVISIAWIDLNASAWAFFYRKPKTEPNRTETEPNSR